MQGGWQSPQPSGAPAWHVTCTWLDVRWRLAAGALGGAAIGLLLSLPTNRRLKLAGRVVVITGGSRGLGLLLARECARRGARVALLARDTSELARAAASIDGPVMTIECDVRDAASAQAAVREVIRVWGAIDVLINNAGVILSAPLAHTTDDDFRAMMDVHFWGTLHMIRAALPHLSERQGARVVNISSIGGRIAVPHLAAYSASKFAQAGLSAALHTELRSQGVAVVTVFPGLMRTGSHVNAQFKGDVKREAALFSLAATLPGMSMDATRAARQIVDATERGVAEVVLSAPARVAAAAAANAPNLMLRTLGWVDRLLPSGDRQPQRAATRGGDLRPGPVIRALTALGTSAAHRNNELLARAIE